ncbi:MAG: hypothetical protein B7Y02_10980, partial [Rhodobacterales bacterium 17-64-5]
MPVPTFCALLRLALLTESGLWQKAGPDLPRRCLGRTGGKRAGETATKDTKNDAQGAEMHLVNRTFDEMQPGEAAEIRRLITNDDLYVFAVASGNSNPMHLTDSDLDGNGA